jgi:hypothetical protein
LADGILSPVYFAVLVHVIVVEIGGEISVWIHVCMTGRLLF